MFIRLAVSRREGRPEVLKGEPQEQTRWLLSELEERS